GAAHAGAAFMEHALIVLILPPVLIVLASVACEMARALAGLERRRLPASQAAPATALRALRGLRGRARSAPSW
ncbi:MAG TPA: hypothetical protein VN654_14530, partial [Vicinamibacterales bacterium]|nr:hypothetical protein [Vicinamibacterales bacterium]